MVLYHTSGMVKDHTFTDFFSPESFPDSRSLFPKNDLRNIFHTSGDFSRLEVFEHVGRSSQLNSELEFQSHVISFL